MATCSHRTLEGAEVLTTARHAARNVIWLIGSSATLGTDTDFAGRILAQTSITVNAGVTVDGQVLAIDGSVTLDTNRIIRPW